MANLYIINEIFASLQGEGARAGTSNVFVRFTGCNLRCDIDPGEKSPGGFLCDTEFLSGRKMSLGEILEEVQYLCRKEASGCRWVVGTGGEPTLQIDREFIDGVHEAGYSLAIETNGTLPLPTGIDWITLSPKVAEHGIRQIFAHEVKYVRGYGQGIPKPIVKAEHQYISPAFDGSSLDPRTLKWCIQLVANNPGWKLSVQQHKGWRVK